MMDIDVSVILNMHKEAPYLRATLLSLEASANVARNVGISCELIAVFDRSDEVTKTIFQNTQLPAFEKIKTTEVDFGSLGLARNAGIELACGKFIWTSDGDDLVSRNAISTLHHTACTFPNSKCVVFIEYLVAFGNQFHVVKYFDGSLLTVADFVYQHSFVSRIFLQRSVFETLCYSDLRISTGYAYEDWELNARLRYFGYEFLIAPDTIFFYRQRNDSLLKKANDVSARMIPHIETFEPKWFVNELDSEKKRIKNWQCFIEKRRQTFERNFPREITETPELRDHLLEACQLDPEIDPAQVEKAVNYNSIPWRHNHWGYKLAEIYRLAGCAKYTDIVLLPWLNAGGGEKYILQILNCLGNSDNSTKFLILCGEPSSKHTWANKLPQNSSLIDIYNAFPDLNDEERDNMTARFLIAIAPKGARLHIKSSIFSHRLLDRFGNVLLAHFEGIYYRFSDSLQKWRQWRFDVPDTIVFLRKHLPLLNKVICDCQYIAGRDQLRIGLATDHYHDIYAKSPFLKKHIAMNQPTHHLCWASRISSEKRPDLLIAIVQQLRQTIPALDIDMYGCVDPDYVTPEALFNTTGINYRGEYDDFGTIPTEQYDVLIYTSDYDGLPNVVLEAMASGQIVIAPNIGGIPEVIADQETGILVKLESTDDAAIVSAYVEAVSTLYANWESRKVILENAKHLLATQHSEETFIKRVENVFQINNHLS